jgi:hypothetical protein
VPDITTLILDDHAWFRRQFAALDELQARDSDPRELARLWEPLAARLDVPALAEETNEGLANFRLNATTGLRESLGRQFAEFLDAHPTTAGLDNSDKDPEAYVDEVQAEIDPSDPTRDGLGIGSLKGK